jgi:hypothetical protein
MESIQVVDQGADEGKLPVPEKFEKNWFESECFQVWLRLARRDYHGRLPAPGKSQK